MVFSRKHANFEASDTPGFADNLLVLNYVMDPAHPALAHQVEVVEALALKFSAVTVLTGKSDWVPTAPNIRVFTSNWIPGQNIKNIYKFFRIFLQLIRAYKFVAVFSHMTTVQSCLVGPILKFRGINHFLWYAHAQNSTILRIAHFWVTKLITSTPGSCPIAGKKVMYLGQSINQETFKSTRNATLPFKRFVHLGRTDPSKNLRYIIETIFHFREFDRELRLEFVGNPSGVSQSAEFEKLKESWADSIAQGWLVFSPAIPRELIPNLLQQHDVFIHAFKGSLDKTLIEATMTRVPVITVNQEYINEFGSWGKTPITLENELASLFSYDQAEVDMKLNERVLKAINNHSKKMWIDNLTNLIKGTAL